MAALTLIAALLAPQAEENPLIPNYPFKSAKITYGTAGKFDGVAWISGTRQYFKAVRYEREKPYEVQVKFTDGRHLFSIETIRDVTKAQKQLHLGAFLRADHAALDDADRKKFAQNLEGLWNRYSPGFGIEWLDEKMKLTIENDEKVCGRDCVVLRFEIGGTAFRYWRWKGTDIILKFDVPGAALAARSVEENAALPADLFQEPAGARMDDIGAGFDADRARKIFKTLCGRDARADPDATLARPATLRIDGKDVRLGRLSFVWTGGEEGALEIQGESSPWSFHGVVAVKVDKIGQLAGKTIKLSAEDSTIEIDGPKVRYVTKDATLKIVSATERALTISVSGAWVRTEFPDDGEEKTSDATVDAFELTATSE